MSEGVRMRGRRRRGTAGVKYGGRMSEGERMRGRRRGRARVKYIGRMSEGGENEREAEERESRSKIWRKDE